MESFYCHSVYDDYAHLSRKLLVHGKTQTSRAGDTVEIEDVVVEFADGRYSMPPARKGTPRLLGLLEGAQLVGSSGRAGLMEELFPAMKTFTDFSAMYGDRVARGNQIEEVIDKLADKPDTRQAVLTLWDPTVDHVEGRRDYPCTVAIQFRIRDDRFGVKGPQLNMAVTMRSNDLVRGFYHDATQFGMLHVTLATLLGVNVGSYVHHAGSFHLYKDDTDMLLDHVNDISTWTEDVVEAKRIEIMPLAEKGWSYAQVVEEVNAALGDPADFEPQTPMGIYIQKAIQQRRKTLAERV